MGGGSLVALRNLAAPLAQATQGITKDEIVLGSIQDLSGPLAGYGKQVRQGMLLRAEEANEQGGVHGRGDPLCQEQLLGPRGDRFLNHPMAHAQAIEVKAFHRLDHALEHFQLPVEAGDLEYLAGDGGGPFDPRLQQVDYLFPRLRYQLHG